MNIINQKPVELSPVYKSSTLGTFDPLAALKTCIVEPLFTPMAPNQPVRIVSKSGDITADEIVQHITNCCGDVINIIDETWCKTLFQQTLAYFDNAQTLSIQDLFLSQASAKAKLPAPSSTCIYTPTSDVIPAAKRFLSGQGTYEEFFASLGYFARPETLGFYFGNEIFFNDFKNWVKNLLPTLSTGYPADTNQLLQDFINTINLTDLTESLRIRNNSSENNHENSFARVIISLLMEYNKTITNPAEFGILPFATGELFCPLSIVFVNVDKHAKATAAQINNEWDIINKSLQNKVTMISNNLLNSLTATQRQLKKAQSAAINAVNNMNKTNSITSKAANIRFKRTPPSHVDIIRYINKIMGHMAQKARSENTYKTMKLTYQKPNRRDPDDYNKPGKTISVKYRPDIHVYIDTSGSISEQNYQSAIKACIKIAKKLNINLYFNSFSHTLSQCTKLNVKDKQLSAIYREFQKVPKVTGGTDYEQIWNYINMSKRRKREFSLIITDFEWSPSTRFVNHPKNLYYMPCAGIDWDECLDSTKNFATKMLRNEPNIRKHILM